METNIKIKININTLMSLSPWCDVAGSSTPDMMGEDELTSSSGMEEELGGAEVTGDFFNP